MRGFNNNFWQQIKYPILVLVIGIILYNASWFIKQIYDLNSSEPITYEELIDKIKAGEIYEIRAGKIIYAFQREFKTDYTITTTKTIIETDETKSQAGLSDSRKIPAKTVTDNTNITVETKKTPKTLQNFMNDMNNGSVSLIYKKYRILNIEDTTELTKILYEDNHNIKVHDPDSYFGMWFMLIYMSTVLLIWYINRNREKAAINKFNPNSSNNNSENEVITFKDVAGEDEAKESLQEIVDFLHNPNKYTRIGAKLPKGALMIGPPGTGKSMLAKAVAGEAKVPFLFKSASEFVEMYVGVGAKRVRELFDEAKRCAPCVVFIDEIDCVGGQRGIYTGGTGGGDSERDQTINQLLTEMDGFRSNKGIVVIAATNRPEMLDQALTRPGRFDRQIIVDKPDLKGREEILKVHCKKVQLDKDVDLHEIALMTTGLVGADLANLVNESCIYAIKKGRNKVKQEDIKQCIDLITIGKEKKNKILSDKEKKIVCQHESGHALAGRILYGESQVEKISVVPVQTGALGYVKPKQTEEKYLKTKEEYNKEIIMLLAGRAAEEISFGKNNITGGCSNDTEKASNLIKAMISMYGMSDEIGLYNVMRQNGQYLNNGVRMDCSPEMQAQIDELVKNKLKNYYRQALKLIKDNKKILDKLGSYLYEHERLTDKEFDKLYEEYCKKSKKKQKNSRK